MINSRLSWINLNNTGGGGGGVSDYNQLSNKPIKILTGTTQAPIKLWKLETGLYVLNGYVQHSNDSASEAKGLFTSVTAGLVNGNYIVSAFIPFWEGQYEYMLPSLTSDIYNDHQVVMMLSQFDVLTLDNETEYTPTNDYHPSTKKYVDDMLVEFREELNEIGINEENIESLKAENRRRDIAIQALISMNSDKMVTIEEETHTISMDYSIDDGMVTINTLEGTTLVNVSKQKDEIGLSYGQDGVVNYSNEITTEQNAMYNPIIEGNTIVNLATNVAYDGCLTGVEVDFTAMTYTKLDNYNRWTVSPYKDMRRCNLLDGEVQCYIGHENYKEDGTNGDVMVEIPKFYYKVVPLTTEANSSGDGLQLVKAQWWVSDKPNDGFKVHPMFVRNGVEVEKVYVSAYEGSLYDVSANTCILDDAQVADFNVDKLMSIANAKPMSGLTQNLTITNAEKLCTNKGNGYIQYDFTIASGLQLLMLVEYCTFDIQSKLGRGIVDITDDGSTNMSLATGETSLLNNLSGYNGTNGKSSVSYHGIENPYGNIWKIVSGLNIECKGINKAYWSNDDKTVNTSTNHNAISFTLCTSNGYISRIGYDQNNDFVFLPTKIDASNNIKDYYWQNNTYNGWTVARLGGLWTDSSYAGSFFWGVDIGSGTRSRYFGCRLAFFKS